MNKKLKILCSFFLSIIFTMVLLPSINTQAATSNSKLLVGYWHNFDNGTGIIKLRDVSPKWDVINVAFGETYNDRAVLEFSPCYGTDAQFKSDVEYLKSQGKNVVLSIGGQNGVVLLPDKAAKDKFVNSTIALIDKYGFNGIDIDLESGISLSGGDRDFKNPTTPQIVNLIDAVKTICAHYGSGFTLSMAPETAYVQGGITAYGNIWGAYLPIIYGLRDQLTYIHVQHYNAGGNAGMDGVNYTQGTADYEVAMADMLLNGFPIENNNQNFFPPLRENQVMIGLPACPSAAPSGGYINPNEMKKALDYIMTGKPFGGKYKLSKASGYPGFKGLMTWSINWDKINGNEFLTNYRAYFGAVTPPVDPTLKAATLSAGAVTNNSFTLTGVVSEYNLATSYKLFEGSTEIGNGTLTANSSSSTNITLDIKNKAQGSYDYTLVLYDASNNSITSNKVTVKLDVPGVLTWAEFTSYKSGDVVSFNNVKYTCRQPHTSLPGWTPAAVPALWQQS